MNVTSVQREVYAVGPEYVASGVSLFIGGLIVVKMYWTKPMLLVFEILAG